MQAFTRSRFHEFQDLMRYRIMDVILVSTPYDTFVLEEAGELSERFFGEFRNLDLHYPPGLTGVSTGREALELARSTTSSKLIITTPHVRDMDAGELARRVKDLGLDVPVVLLAWDTNELAAWAGRAEECGIERTFLWQGDAQILVAMVKSVEDWRNVAHDVRTCGVQVILVIEDLVRHWSSFLPRMYQVLLETSRRVVREGLNLSQKILRMRARPKILLCTNYEEAAEAFEAYQADVMGIVSDVEFPRGGVNEPLAGAEFSRMVRQRYPDIPIILHSTKPAYAALARELGAGFLLKGSPLMLEQLEHIMFEVFGFGDFSFRLPDGQEVGRASNLGELQRVVATVPVESVLFHSQRNHFSRWLKARTEFALAQRLRPVTIADVKSPEELRRLLLEAITEYRYDRGQHVVAEFDRSSFDFSSDFYRIGGGSIGGKARGVAFLRRMIGEYELRNRFPGVEIHVPPTVVIGTQVFDAFLEDNDLRSFALDCTDEAEIVRRFEEAPLPADVELDLAAFIDQARWPLAVRSSSLLEDSQHQPFTGVYDTLMFANDSADTGDRLRALTRAIKRVYASTFGSAAKGYIAATPYRLEEEKMAVMLQRVVGAARGERFYPDFAGVVRSYNFYPVEPMTAEDGIAAVALGLGRAVVGEGSSLRFCPRCPQNLPELSTVKDVLSNTQRQFWALPLGPQNGRPAMREKAYDLAAAEADGVLAAVASTYSPENDAIYDGTSRTGPRVVTFAPILKLGLFPLAEILCALMELGEDGLGTAVEIEFAATLATRPGTKHEFGVLQMRPMSLMSEAESLEIGPIVEGSAVAYSRRVLGTGRIEGIRDLVVVDFNRFERAHSVDTAAEIGRLNARLVSSGTPYVLIGVGRWGSRDPWLGIPVNWDQVSGARVIVEAGLRDLQVTPSQGSHFFQNLTAFNVGYFTVNPELGEGYVDWEWLDAQPHASAVAHVRHIRLDEPLLVTMNGKKGEGVILKPDFSRAPE
jgi:CheY-like chemotaxis protein